ncbi:hypothetical protein ACFLSE_10245 [Bacteroidota bacterium]
MRSNKFLPLLLVLFFSFHFAIAQEQGGYEDLLYREVEVVNPVYMPVVGIGTGIINYYGELQTDFKNLIQGTPSYRVNLFQYIDNKHSWKININGMFGNTSGYERSFGIDTAKNLNFETNFYSIGVNLEYAFGDLFKGEKQIRPFISIGGEYLTLNSLKTDVKDGNDEFYTYYPDGTIRVNDQITTRDYVYETNIRDYDRFGRGKDFSLTTFALVADAGFDFKISNRVALRIASSLHYTWTDDLDAVSKENTVGRIGDSKNDMFSFTYVALNVDLFSSPKSITQELLFADVEFDPVAYSDSDRDRILDLRDDCPNTPRGVQIDSVGCPRDDDRDGIPNYIDKEQFSNKGAIVDEFGVELSANKIRDGLVQDLTAVDRTEVYMVPVGLGWSKYSEMTNIEIPEKYKKLDRDSDDYISFDELLDAINGFFDFDSEFKTEDIYDLNNFFFAQ